MSDSRRLLLVLAILAAGITCWLAWSPLGANEIVGGDEGYYGVMARNILADARSLLSLPLSPLGPPGDKPPLYPALLALSIRLFGPGEIALRWISIAAAAVIGFVLAGLLGRAETHVGRGRAPEIDLLADPAAATTRRSTSGARPLASGVAAVAAAAAAAAAAFFVSLPWIADASRVCAAEPVLTALGAVALLLLTAARPTPRRDALAGALLGCAFLCKFWLVALVALPAVLALAPWTREGWRRVPLVAGAAFAVAGLHLGAVAVLQRESLSHWWNIYLGFSLAGRASGQGFADSWLLPPAAYWNLLAHALTLLMPLVAMGVEEASRRWREPVPRVLLAWAGGAAVLSAFAVKSGGYAYVVMPAWVGLAALGLAALAAGRSRSPVALLAGVALIAPPVVARLGGNPIPMAPWAAVGAATLAAWALARLRPGAALPAAALLGMAITLGGFAREALRLPAPYHVPGYREVARAIAPRLAEVPPGRAVFVAPEAPALAYYLFRTGQYWGTTILPWTPQRFAAVRTDTALRVFVVDSRRELYGGWPDAETVAWLESATREITSELKPAGAPAPRLRLFVRDP